MKRALVPPSKQSPKRLNAAYADLASNILTHTVACCLVIVRMYNLLKLIIPIAPAMSTTEPSVECD